MAALTRESSFERVLSNMNRSYTTNYETIAAQNEASCTISTWLKKNNKLKAVYKAINPLDIISIKHTLNALSDLDSGSFTRGQEILATESFVQAFHNFLNLLPSDPSLKKKNKMARSVRIISSCLLITKFPGVVLEADGSPDTGKEALACNLAAVVFMAALQRLLRLLQQPTTTLESFKTSLIGYRFALRNFFKSIDAWKQIDKDRLKHSFEVAYCDSYMVIWTSQMMVEKLTEQLSACPEDARSAMLQERDNSVAFIKSGSARLAQFRDMLGKLLGPSESKDLLEELDAYLLSSTQSLDVKVELRTDPEHLPSDQQVSTDQVVAVEQPLNLHSETSNVLSTGPSAATSSSTPPPHLSPEMMKLNRVSMMTGMGENNILHELCVNPKFQLPDPLPPLRPFDSHSDGYVPLAFSYTDTALLGLMQGDPLRGKEVLKQMMIKTIEDRFVANMTQSKVHTVSEVVVGGVYPVWYGSDGPDRLGGGGRGVFMHAQVLSIHVDGDRMECKYTVDGLVETDVPLSRVKLVTHPRDAVGSGFLSFMQDMVNRISALIPSRSDMHAQLNTAIDLTLLKQMVEKDAMSVGDLVSLLSTLVSFITKLQSPQRSTEFIEWFNPFAMVCHSQPSIDDTLLYIPKFFEVTSERLDQMQLEIANYYLSGLAAYAQAEGPGVFQNTVSSKIEELVRKEHSDMTKAVVVEEHYAKYLPRTTSFLCDQLKEPVDLNSLVLYLRDVLAVGPADDHATLASLAIGSAAARKVDVALMARAFSQLLQQNVDLGSPAGGQLLPETFLWDGERLRNLKNEIDSLVLVTTLLISCRSYLLSVKKRLSVPQEVALQDLLYEVLRDSSVSLTEVVTTAQNFVRKNFSAESTAAGGVVVLPAGWEGALEEALKKCVTQSSPVFSLFSKRVHSVVTKAVLDVPFTDLLGRFSMNSRPQIQQLKIIISSAKGLFAHNTKTFGAVYSSMLRLHCEADSTQL